METLKDLWNNACLSADIPAISIDTCARIFAVLYVHGNNEDFVYNKSFLSDIEYIKERFNVYGTGIPDANFVVLLKKYVKELEDYIKLQKEENEETPENKAIFKSQIPNWALKLFHERYSIKLIN